MEKNFSKILVSLLIISFVITPVAFASDNLQNTNIETKSVGQEVKDRYIIFQESDLEFGGKWTNTGYQTDYKFLYPPTGYQYVQSERKTVVLGPWKVFSEEKEKYVWIRQVEYHYSYKLSPL